MTRKSFLNGTSNAGDSGEESTYLKPFHWIVLGLSVVLTLFAWFSVNSQRETLVLERYDQEVARVIEMIRDRMYKYELALWAGVATIKANHDDISYQYWLDFSEKLEIDVKYPGINGIGVIYPVAKENVSSFEAFHQNLRPEFKVYPKHNNDLHLPITYIEPVKTNAEAVGLDMAHETNRFRAALKSRDTGDARATGPITLVQDKNKTPGFLFYTPFYYTGDISTVELRQKRFAGLVYAPFVVKSLMSGVLGEQNRNVHLRILDGGEILYNEFGNVLAKNIAYEKSVPLDFYGRQWMFDIRAKKLSAESSAKRFSITILFGGFTITGLLFFLFQAHARTQNRAIEFAKQMTAKLEEKTVKLKRSNEDLEQFAYVASHDLQEPLRVVGNFTQLLQRRYQGQLDENADIYIQQIVDGATQMQQLLIDLLDFARITSSDKIYKSVNLNDLLEGLLKDLAVSINESKAVIKVVSLPTVMGEKTQLYQVFQNLLSNAIKFRSQERELHIRILLEERAKDWVISVSDNGIGIEAQFQEKIFLMFQRLHNRSDYLGSGIGLAICKKVMLMHEGNISVESIVGRGATFHCVLPK